MASALTWPPLCVEVCREHDHLVRAHDPTPQQHVVNVVEACVWTGMHFSHECGRHGTAAAHFLGLQMRMASCCLHHR